MQIEITGNVEITEGMVSFISHKMSKLERLHPSANYARVSVKVENDHQEVMAFIFDNSGKEVIAKAKGSDAYEATDRMVDVAARQLAKCGGKKGKGKGKVKIDFGE
ncbi:ribosome-associated translation inhibitor RaiA [Escherichia phage V5]|jgi:ribosomal subunit interface protein|uniref:Ribosome hibernation factor n=10 Tax=Vequintavirus TaxID=1914852 RepID=A0AAE8AYD7_9CAUD|nr:ribosome-associated translation inhibitor RaiA [Escherichia coli]YP_002003641.1 ribosome-associated translation inhibitor RaiA [Escherichia phage V5]AKE45703.1 ribosome hibernation promoting factor [Escherichia coli O157 typing phage 5]ATW61484.1 hypothetical protein 203_0133 [Phage 203]ATW61697.1 hypothetical protein 206_0133 [Phage 206]AXC42814.1 sigma 54 modulation factor [Escherichia phage LL12]AXU22538.1 putative sigma 54 modulation factor [Escherichia phage vB_EcoM-Pr121LW]EKM321772